MLKIRMQRTGRINAPSYRLIVAEHTRGPRTGNIVEKVGTYDPKSKQRTLNEERIKYWMSVGAKPSATVHNMLVSLGLLNAKKINVLPSYKAPAAAESSGEAQPEAPAESVAAEAPADSTNSPQAAGDEPTEEPKEDAPADSAPSTTSGQANSSHAGEAAAEEQPAAASAESSDEPKE